MEPQYENNGTKSVSSLDKKTIIGLGVLLAVIFLAGVGVAYWLIPRPDTAAQVVEADGEQPPEEWPTTAPTFTATASPTTAASPTATPEPTSTPTPAPTPTPTPIVIGWQELGELVTAKFTGVQAVEYTRDRPFPLPDEKILLKVVGNINTGIDLTQIEDSDVKVRGTSVEVILPRAKVTDVVLLPDQTVIYDDGWFPAEGLEIEALNKGKEELEAWAVGQGNLLDLSEKLGRIQIEDFLRKLGFREIVIKFESKEGI